MSVPSYAEFAAPALVVLVTASILWSATGVRAGEIARFVPYELGFVLLPGWLAYRALIRSPGGRLRQLVLGWSLGYVLEILAFVVTAQAGARGLFVVYPLAVGLPSAYVVWRRRRGAAVAEATGAERGQISFASIGLGALLCVALLLYATSVGFSENPLPRDVGTVTYQEDTVFTISVAAETLNHWPVTLPMVAGEPLHYHLFAYIHMAAISQVTGIDLSVVVMRLYMVPLLVLFALQLVLAGRRLGGTLSSGLLAAFVVLFLGELDPSRTTRFLFSDSFFYWLLSSHTFLLGLVFLIPSIVLLSDLLGRKRASSRAVGTWLLVAAFLVGCIGAKSYTELEIVAGLAVFLVLQLWRERALSRPALFALGLSAAVYFVANAVIFRWNSAGAVVRPFRLIRNMPGVEDLSSSLARMWGSAYVSPVLEVGYGTVGLLGIPLIGIGLLLMYKRRSLTVTEVWLLALFLAALPPLFLLSQPGRGQLFLVFSGVVPGAILAASGFRLFWIHTARGFVSGRTPGRALLAAAAVTGSLLLGLLNTPLDWFPAVAGKAKDVPSPKDEGVTGMTAGLYSGLLWVRDNTDPNAVLAVNNHSLYPDERDSKYFYYSAFAQRRVVLESWDYTPQTAARGKFSLDAAHTPFPRRLRLSDATFHSADELAIRKLARDYGARFLVLDKVHGSASRWLPARARGIFSNGDVDVYAVGKPSRSPIGCPFEHGAGIAAVFGHRRTVDSADALRKRAERVGFPGLTIQQRGCRDYAVVLTGLQDLAQARDFRRQAATVGYAVKLECRTQAPEGGLNAVFGHRRTKLAAEHLAAQANAAGFPGLDVRQDACGDWEVDLEGLETAAQRGEFRREAAKRGFTIAFEAG